MLISRFVFNVCSYVNIRLSICVAFMCVFVSMFVLICNVIVEYVFIDVLYVVVVLICIHI